MYKFIFLYLYARATAYNYSFINLPDEQLPYYFANFPYVLAQCKNDSSCPYRNTNASDVCWGYEDNCNHGSRYSEPHCPGDHRGWVQTKSDQRSTFYSQADFGYIKQQLLELKVVCEPFFSEDSSLECTDHMRFCRGRNVVVNFTGLAHRDEPIRYKMDVLGQGDIGLFKA